MAERPLTTKQLAVLRELENFLLPPTVRELAEAMGWTKSAVSAALGSLIGKGRVRLDLDEEGASVYRAVRDTTSRTHPPAPPRQVLEQAVRSVLGDLLDQEQERHVPRWHPDDQQAYQESTLSHEEVLEVVRRQRLDRACQALRQAGVVMT